jgi:hypothetical protein
VKECVSFRRKDSAMSSLSKLRPSACALALTAIIAASGLTSAGLTRTIGSVARTFSVESPQTSYYWSASNPWGGTAMNVANERALSASHHLEAATLPPVRLTKGS